MQAASVATGAGRTVREHRRVSQLAGCAAVANIELAAVHEAGDDSCSHMNVEQMLVRGIMLALPELAQRGGLGAVGHHDRHPETLLQHLCDRDLFPAV